MNLRILSPADLPAVARIHLAAFPRAAISRLGGAAAHRYYDSLMCGPQGTIGLGAFGQNQLGGFCFVGVRHVAESYYVRRHAWYLAWRMASRPWLLLEPVIRDRMGHGLRMLLSRFRPPPAAAPGARGSARSYGIQYLAVDPGCQGRGVGRQLLGAAEELARRHGDEDIFLSVYPDNARAIGFYERMGWQRLAPDGAWRGLMSKCLAPADSAAVPGPAARALERQTRRR